MRLKTRAFWLLILILSAACSPTGQPPAPSAVPTLTAPSPSSIPTRAAAPTHTPQLASSDTPAPQPTAVIPPTGPLSGAALLDALRAGGYVIYFRHGATDPIPDDASPVDLADCGTQRHLSAAGEAQARQIGQAFQALGIPVGSVLASPFCRALDTARLAFGRAEVEPALENLETSPDAAERERRTAGLQRLLSTPPAPGTNTILAAHGFNISAAAQVTLPEGGAAVFRPDGAGGFDLVASLKPDEWAALER